MFVWPKGWLGFWTSKVGYKLSPEAGNDPVLNPAKVRNGEIVSVNLCEDDQFIVLAESPEVR